MGLSIGYISRRYFRSKSAYGTRSEKLREKNEELLPSVGIPRPTSGQVTAAMGDAVRDNDVVGDGLSAGSFRIHSPLPLCFVDGQASTVPGGWPSESFHAKTISHSMRYGADFSYCP